MRTGAKRTLTTVAMMFTLAFAGIAKAETGVTDKEIVIGTANALSGPSAFAGRELNVGFNTYIKRINAEGGVNGRKIRVVSEDDKYEPEAAIACFNDLQKQGAFGLAALYGSTGLTKYLPMCTNYKVPALGFYAGPIFVNEPVKKYAFTTRPSYQDEEHQVIEHLWKDLRIRRIAVIFQNDPFGADHLKGISDQLSKYQGKIVEQASYTRNSDYKNTLRQAYETVKKSAPQAVILAAVYTPAAEVVKMAQADKWEPLFYVNTGTNVDGFVAEAGSAAEGVIAGETVPPPSRTDLPLVSQYLKDLKKYYPDEKPYFTSLRGYVYAIAWVEGLKRAGKNLTRETFVNALEGMHKVDLGLGSGFELSYSNTDHLGIHKVFFGVFKDGRLIALNDWKTIKH